MIFIILESNIEYLEILILFCNKVSDVFRTINPSALCIVGSSDHHETVAKVTEGLVMDRPAIKGLVTSKSRPERFEH